jgi:hypothetical protein
MAGDEALGIRWATVTIGRREGLSSRCTAEVASQPLKPGSKCRMSAERRLSHDDEARSLQVLDDPLGCDLRHVFVGLMHTLFAAEAQGESDCLGKVLRVGGRKLVIVGRGVM